MRPEDPYPRVVQLRRDMREFGLGDTPILMAGGVWNLSEWEDWIDNPDLGPIAFQFGTRALLTRESPISDTWKRRLMTLKKGDVFLNRFSPTGFWSSAVNNSFVKELRQRARRQVAFTTEPMGTHTEAIAIGPRKRVVYMAPADRAQAERWIARGYSQPMRTPDSTLIFVTPEKALSIRNDQIECMGCLSQCRFSNWSQSEARTTGRKADPRSSASKRRSKRSSTARTWRTNFFFRPWRLSFRNRPVLFQWFHPDRPPARRAAGDRRLRTGGS